MKEERKSYVMPTIYLLILLVLTIGVYFTKKTYDNYEDKVEDNITYVSSSIFNRTVPIVSIPELIKTPYDTEGVSIARYFYNSSDDETKKEKSIVFYENVYMPNTGVDYVSSQIFDVMSVYDGTVIDVMEDELLGKTVKIRHNNEIISVYQGLGTVNVSKGDVIFTGQRIGSSGTSKLNKDLGNHLHFEIYKNGVTIDPISCIDKKIGDI